MKRTVFFLMAALLTVMSSCQANGSFKYQVSGQLPDNSRDGETLYLSDMASGEHLDSTTIQGGSYTFSGKADGEKLCVIRFGRPAVRFILQPGNISIDHQLMAARGTALNDSICAFVEALESLEAPEDTEEAWTRMIVDYALPVVKANADNLYGTYALWFTLWAVQPSGELFDSLLANASEASLKFAPIQDFIARNEAVKATEAGKMFTDFTIPGGNLDGSDAKLSQYVGKGKYVLVDFWASWCGPCRREIPIVAELYKKYHGPKFDVLGVAVWDQPEATLRAAKELGIVWNQIINAQSIPTDLYGIGGIPHIILFGPDGTIIERDLRGDHMKEVVAKYVGKK